MRTGWVAGRCLIRAEIVVVVVAVVADVVALALCGSVPRVSCLGGVPCCRFRHPVGSPRWGCCGSFCSFH